MWISQSFVLSSRTLVPVRRFISVTSGNIWPYQVANHSSPVQWMECLLRAFGVFPLGLLFLWLWEMIGLSRLLDWLRFSAGELPLDSYRPIYMYDHCTVSDLKLNPCWFSDLCSIYTEHISISRGSYYPLSSIHNL
jgi:hypothetical protein